MKKLLFLTLLAIVSEAKIPNINYYEANFIQKIVDDKNKTITYYGSVKASKAQNALWEYTKPVNKKVYILKNRVFIIEPDLEQVIIKRINNNFDFFSLIKNAKEINKNHYIALFNNIKYHLYLKNNILKSISYKDEFDNATTITFKNIEENKKINEKYFKPNIPEDYDLIKE